jgi:hypothetical protein
MKYKGINFEKKHLGNRNYYYDVTPTDRFFSLKSVKKFINHQLEMDQFLNSEESRKIGEEIIREKA